MSKKNQFPHMQGFQLNGRPGKKKNSWWNPNSKNYWRRTDGGRKAPAALQVL